MRTPLNETKSAIQSTLSRLSHLVATALCAVLLLGSAVPVDAQTSQLQGVVNVNLATAEELELLPGVGPSRAAAIIAYREEHGPFEQVDDLVQVPGIAEKSLARIRQHCAVEGHTTAKLEN